MGTIIINGRRITIPDSGMYGSDLIDQVNPEPGRRVVKHGSGHTAETINPGRWYSKYDLIDKKNNPVKLSSIPDRTKGGYGATRSTLSRQIITEQVYDLAQHYYKNGLDFDEDNADWMVIPSFRLPRIWHLTATQTPLLIVFPTEYPGIPPVGFYLKAALTGAPDGHLFPQVFHGADHRPLQHNWKWYCVYIPAGSWKPAPVRKSGDWRHGDNLWTYFTLINEVLNNPRG